MNPPFTRKQLQTFNPNDMLRKKAIDKTIESLTHLIFSAAAGTKPRNHEQWKIIGAHKLVIQKEFYTNNIYVKNPYTETTETFPDIIPDVIKQLALLFPDVDIRQDELASYIIVDWSN